jgi:PiT family inorganic phosphate transporter
MRSDLLIVLVVAAALAFDFTNGFRDTANTVASAVSTRALSTRTAVLIAAALNFAGAFISLAVATTVGSEIFVTARITETIVFAGLIGAISWDLVTWFAGLPSSSSHALIGGLTGSTLAAVGTSGLQAQALIRTVVAPALVAPVLAFVIAGIAIVIVYRFVGGRRPGVVTDGFRLGQLVSTSMLSLAHGTNDAQKTMGVITLALVAHGTISAHHFHVPAWVILAAASAIALGTYAGGSRIIHTAGTRIKMDVAQGFTAQGAGAAVILVSSYFGYPLSTTHVISGGIMGAGAAKRVSAVRWGIAGHIAAAWILTIPAAALAGAITYGVTDLFGAGVLGPLLITILAIGLLASVLVRRGRSPHPARA